MLYTLSDLAVYRAILPMAATRSWDGATQTRIVSCVSSICVPSWPIEEYPADIKVKSIFCFVIAPEMQRKGVATKLVERVCRDAADEGFDFVEAYVNKKFVETDHDFRGPLDMYLKCGFDKYAQREDRVTVRKALK
ncbi:MAG: GNAT family N-acetyltransferase [Clostridia bacterium]